MPAGLPPAVEFLSRCAQLSLGWEGWGGGLWGWVEGKGGWGKGGPGRGGGVAGEGKELYPGSPQVGARGGEE